MTSRGNERRAIFRDDQDRGHFLELLEAVSGQFGVRLHAYVLMDNHYHLLVETPRANLSRAMQWLNVSYSGWFNRRHQRAGHLFQGRFKAIVLDRDESAVEVSRYVHLNPVRVRRYRLDKAARQRSRAGLRKPHPIRSVAGRVAQLRRYRWSSYRAYIGLDKEPEWLTCRELHGRLGGRRSKDQERKLSTIRGKCPARGTDGASVGAAKGRDDSGKPCVRRQVVQTLAGRCPGAARGQSVAAGGEFREHQKNGRTPQG